MSILILRNKNPYEVLLKKVPNYERLRVFRILCYAHNHDKLKHKFSFKVHRCVFHRYPHVKKRYKVYDLEKEKMFVTKDVVFYEKIFPFEPNTTTLPHS